MTFEPQRAAAVYDRANETGFRDTLKRFLAGVLRGDRDVELQPARRLILTDPAGNRWAFTVNASGVLVSTAL